MKTFLSGLRNKNNKGLDMINYLIISLYVVVFLMTAFFFNNPKDIIQGMKDILLAPSILVSDYFYVGNVGAAILNSSLIMIISILIALFNKSNMNGPIIAGIFTIGGFALFGKNIYNIWAIFIGVYLYSHYKREKFGENLTAALFGTALAPMISNLSFGLGLEPTLGIILGNLCGILAGFMLVPLAASFKNFHKSYNLYNVGFTAGILGTLFMALFRSFGLESQSLSLTASGYNKVFTIYLAIYFASMILVGFLLKGGSFKGYRKLLTNTGRPPNDFVQLYGFEVSLINMGIMGLLMLAYILLVGGELNGTSIGAIMVVAGFSAFGNHPLNSIPISLGVYVASLFTKWEASSTSLIFAATFGTALAPIAGDFGFVAGIIAGLIHVAVVNNVGFLHGGMNLYNNGFSAGIVAAIVVIMSNAIKSKREA
mgnify:CR=1 FL=1